MLDQVEEVQDAGGLLRYEHHESSEKSHLFLMIHDRCRCDPENMSVEVAEHMAVVDPHDLHFWPANYRFLNVA